jgi:hypothetical protein
MRVINVAAAQLGPIQKAESREAVVKRMIATEMSLSPQARAASTQPTLRRTFTSARAKRM